MRKKFKRKKSDKYIMIPDRHDSSRDESSVEGVCIVITDNGTIGARKKPQAPFKGRDKKLTLTVLEVIEEDVETLRLDTILLHNNAAASNNLSGVTLTIDLAETSPGTEDLGVSDLDKVDFVLSAERLNELNVLGLCAGLDEDAQMGLALVQGLCALTETASETVMDEGVLQNLLYDKIKFRTSSSKNERKYKLEEPPLR